MYNNINMMIYKVFMLLVFLFVVTAAEAENKKKVLCYFANWLVLNNGAGHYGADNIDPFLCSHILYSFEGIDDNGSIHIIDDWSDFTLHQLADVTAIKKVNPELKVLVSVGGWNEGSFKYSEMVKDPERRRTFINSTMQFILKNELDGMDLDWEYPGRRGGDEQNDKANFVILLKELREAFDVHQFILTAAVAPTGQNVDISYDVPALTKYLDYINLMEYDYHGDWDGYTGHNAPLFVSPTDKTPEQKSWNINASIKKWLEEGADPEKLVLGIAFYGHSYTLKSPLDVNVSAETSAPGPPGPYLRTPGTLGYNEICEEIQKGNWTIKWDNYAFVPYMDENTTWVSYDNVESIKWKCEYSMKQKLGGVFVWALGYDDFHGNCGKKNILMSAIHEVLWQKS